MTEQEKFMKAALRLAKKAADEGEVPVGCVVVRDGQIVGRGRNRRESKKNALGHAEIEAIHKACRKLGGWRLHQCDLYVTLEPCPMCTGAIINARIQTVYFGAPDPKAGSCGSVVNLFDLPYNHKPKVVSGLLEQDCIDQLQAFFRALRARKKAEKQYKKQLLESEQSSEV
nr:tRNA adenosine(34) deaminase TadA [uncultured Butyricicoccus sp.]